MDPASLVILLAMGGMVSAWVAFRRGSAGSGPSRAFRASDPASLLVGGLVVAGAIAVAYLLVVGR